MLWAFEGITSYYDDLFLLRCGLISVDDYEQRKGRYDGVRDWGVGQASAAINARESWCSENSGSAAIRISTWSMLAANCLLRWASER